MTERGRLEALKQVGLTAWQGLKVAVTGVDVVIDPGEPAPGEPGAAGAAGSASSEQIGTVIGRRALAASTHQMGAALRSSEGVAVATEELLAGAPLTLSVYPGAGAALVAEALGVEAATLPVDGDLETESVSRDLAWLPLATGRQIYSRVAGSRLLAVGGYRRAALVRFEGARPRFPGVWCCLGDDALGRPDVQEEPARLLRFVNRGEVERALLGGSLLEQALQAPGAVVEAELGPTPVWGLFSSGRHVAVPAVEDGAVLLVPVDDDGAVSLVAGDGVAG